MATKNFLAYQILQKIYGNNIKPSNPIQVEDVVAAINQKINALYKAEQFANLQSGETIPPNAFLMTFENIPVTSLINRKSESKLPAMPINLPRGMGVFSVEPSPSTACVKEFIPIQANQSFLLQSQDVVSDLLGQVTYEVNGNKIIFGKDIAVDGVKAVTMKLVLMDVASYDEYTPLPLTSDLENQIVQEVYASFMPQPTQPRLVDSYNDNAVPNGK